MELKEGMYVRTKRGQIGEIITISENNVAIEFNKMWQDIINIENVIKASYNIIDLIEVDDYVNGSKVFKLNIDEERDTYTIILDDTKILISEHINSNDLIKSIVTKEQFESMSYKVKE